MKEEIKRWLKRSEEEFETAKIDFDAKKYFAAAFWCQQSVEKAFKALLIKKTNTFPKVHDLTYLAKLNDSPKKILVICSKINPAYTASRYPDMISKYSRTECKQILEECKEVLKWIKERIS